MKKLIISLLTASILLLPACNIKDFFSFNFLNGDDTGIEEFDYDAMYNVTATDSLNYYVDLLNDTNETASYFQSDLSYFEFDMNNYPNLGYDPSFTCYFELYDYDNLKNMTSNPSGLTEEEVATIIPMADKVFTSFDAIKTLCKNLSVYVTAQDYETDNFAQGKTIVADIYTALDSLNVAGDELSAYSDTLMAKYNTWEVDPNDPVSVGLGNMDEDTNLGDDITNLLEDAYTRDSFDRATELQTLYDELNASFASHTGTNKPVIEDTYIASYYDTFYSEMEMTFLPIIKRSVRDFANQDLEGMYTDYSDSIDSYNVLINNYNYYLDADSY